MAGSHSSPDQPFFHERRPEFVGEGDDAGEVGGGGLIHVGSLGGGRSPVQAELGGATSRQRGREKSGRPPAPRRANC